MDVQHNEADSRFETTVAGGLALAAYSLRDGVATFTHTEVPQAAEGQGVASVMVKFALDHAKREGWKVVPQCSFVKGYIDRHSEYKEMVAAE